MRDIEISEIASHPDQLRSEDVDRPDFGWIPGVGDLVRASLPDRIISDLAIGCLRTNPVGSLVSTDPRAERATEVHTDDKIGQRSDTDRAGDRNSSAAPSTNTKIFYDSEFVNHSPAELWPEATRGMDTQGGSIVDGSRQESGNLKNRASRVVALDLLSERTVDQTTACKSAQSKRGRSKIPHGQIATIPDEGPTAASENNRPFRRFVPARTVPCPDMARPSTNSTLRTYIADKAKDANVDKLKTGHPTDIRRDSEMPRPDWGFLIDIEIDTEMMAILDLSLYGLANGLVVVTPRKDAVLLLRIRQLRVTQTNQEISLEVKRTLS